MSSIANINAVSKDTYNQSLTQSPSKRAKAMAIKYTNFQKKKHQQNLNRNQKLKCILDTLHQAHKKVYNTWKAIVPVSVRGPLTPHESIEENASSEMKAILNNIPFSKNTLNECIIADKHAVLLTYTQRKAKETMRNIDNNQNIILISRSKIPILPMRIQGLSLNKQESRVAQIIEKTLPDNFGKQLVVVIKKGLFDEIIVLDCYDLGDSHLYEKVLKCIDDRESFECQVKSIASYERKLEQSCQPFTEKPTNTTRSETIQLS